MKLNLRSLLHLAKQYPAEFTGGKWKANYIHVGSRPRTVIKECFHSISREHRTRTAVNSKGQPIKPARWALYLGAILALRSHRRLCEHYRF